MRKSCFSALIGFILIGLLASSCADLGINTDSELQQPTQVPTTGPDLTQASDDQPETDVTLSGPGSGEEGTTTAGGAGQLGQAISEVDIQDLIERILVDYTGFINGRQAEEAFALFTEELQRRVPVEELVDGTSTSYISRLNVSQVILQDPVTSNDADEQSGRAAIVFASFRSDQDPAFAQDAQPCSIWEMEYRLEEIGERWLIDSATALGGSPFPCPIVAQREPVDVPDPTLPGQTIPDEKPAPDTTPGQKPVVHLTLDDGPGPETPRYLALFDEYNVKATFFVNSNKISGRQEVTRQIVDSGHAIANHTHTHCNLKNPSKLTPVSQCGNRTAQDEIGEAQDIVAATTGVTPKCFRPPFGAQSQATRAVVAGFGLANWLWDIDTNDWQFNAANRNYTDEQAIAELNKSATLQPSFGSEGVIILLHDGTASAPRMLKLLRTWLDQNADVYEFKTLTGC